MKRFFSIIGVIALVCFSFYYTDLATIIIRENDPIMKQIKRVSNNYEEASVNATLSDNFIIPGISGIKVDVEDTYFSMKRYGSFNDNLLVFEEVLPSISLSNIYDRYIKSGNSTKNMVSLIFLIDDYNYLTEIINILDSKNIKATFFVEGSIIDESKDVLSLIKKSRHQVELYSKNYDKSDIKRYRNIIGRWTDSKINYCLLSDEDNNVLSNCSKEKMYTIIPNINTNKFPYNDVKNNITSGSIIKLNNNDYTLRELKYIINYIRQKGFKMVELNTLLEE